MNHPNQELILRVKLISDALPFLEGKFNDAVEAEINRKKSPGEKGDPLDKYLKAIEPAFNELAEYKESLAAELANRGPACTKLAVALRGGFDVPKPYAFIFDALCELESESTNPITPPKIDQEKPEFNKREKQSLASWTDEYRKANPSVSDTVLAERYCQHLCTTHQFKNSSYNKGSKEESIIAITRTIREIRQGRKKKSSNEKS